MWLFFFEILSFSLKDLKTSPLITILLLLAWFIVPSFACDRIDHFSDSMSRPNDCFGHGIIGGKFDGNACGDTLEQLFFPCPTVIMTERTETNPSKEPLKNKQSGYFLLYGYNQYYCNFYSNWKYFSEKFYHAVILVLTFINFQFFFDNTFWVFALNDELYLYV